MDRPPFEQMSKVEQARNKACLNEYLGRQLAEAETNRKRMNAKQIIEFKENEYELCTS